MSSTPVEKVVVDNSTLGVRESGEIYVIGGGVVYTDSVTGTRYNLIIESGVLTLQEV